MGMIVWGGSCLDSFPHLLPNSFIMHAYCLQSTRQRGLSLTVDRRPVLAFGVESSAGLLRTLL